MCRGFFSIRGNLRPVIGLYWLNINNPGRFRFIELVGMLSFFKNPAVESSKDTGIVFPLSPPWSNQNQNQASDRCTSSANINFSVPQMLSHTDGDSGSGSFPLSDVDSWSVSSHLSHPGSSSYVSNSSYHHSMSLQEIEGEGQELMKLYEGMPESPHELSFKHLVDHNAAVEQVHSDDSPTSKETDNSLEKQSASGGHIKRKGDNPKDSLLNKFAPRCLLVRSNSRSASRIVRQKKNQSSGISAKKAVRKERPPIRLLSLLRIRPFKTPEISPSSKASQVSPRPYLGSEGQPDLPFMGSPNGPKSNSSNQCVMCSAYTVFFKTQCQACKKVYCSNCVKSATVNTRKGLRCQATCAFGSNSDRNLESKTSNCCLGLSCNKTKSVNKIKYSCSEDEERREHE